MRLLSYVLILSLFLFSCYSKKEEKKLLNNDVLVSNSKDSLKKSLPIYNIDKVLFEALDSIIKEENSCPFYDSAKSGFAFTITCDSVKYSFQVSSVNIYSYDYAKSSGVFIYRKHRFIIESYCKIDLMYRSDKNLLVRYLDLDYENRPLNNDDRYSSWYFNYIDNKVMFAGHQPCFNSKD